MGQVKRLVSHSLGAVEAKTRLCSFVGSMMREYPDQVHQLQIKFAGNELQVCFSAYGIQNQWLVKIYSDSIELTGNFPESANPYLGKIEKTVVGRIEDLLSENLQTVRAA